MSFLPIISHKNILSMMMGLKPENKNVLNMTQADLNTHQDELGHGAQTSVRNVEGTWRSE